MKNILTLYILTSFFCLAFFSCDIIEPPYRETVQVDTNATEYVRKVLIEEYTGFRCGNCPEAAEHAHKLADFFKGKVFLLKVHAGYYAIPTNQYTYDFRIPEATELDKFFGCSKAGNPNGLISRYGYPTKSHILRDQKWEEAIKNLLKEKPKMMINLNNSYEPLSREITTNVEIKFLEESKPNYALALYIVEDSIVQYQQDDRKRPPDVWDFVHDDILRGSMNGTWGTIISDTPIPAGTTIQRQFKYVIPQEKDWRPQHLKIMAFVHDHQVSYEIYQIEVKKIIQ